MLKPAEPFNFFSHDPEAINKHLASGNAVCMVLNKDLPPRSLGKGVNYGYVLVDEYKGEERLIVAHGCYRKPVKRFDLPDPEVLRKCKKAKQLTEGIYPVRVFKAHLSDPLCIVVSNELKDTQLDMFKRTYEMFEIEYEGEPHSAIACVYNNPDYQTEGKIIAQWYN